MSVAGGPQCCRRPRSIATRSIRCGPPDGRWIYFRLEDEFSLELARVRPEGGPVERLTRGEGW